MHRPDFLYIGMPRAGSTWLYEVLRAHPDIYVPPAKDIYFFDRYFDRGLKWYSDFFKEAGTAKAAGELSHDYYYSPEAAKRIHHTLPEVRLICCLREPISWAVSAYNYSRMLKTLKPAFGVPDDISFGEFIRLPQITHMLDYSENLKRYYDLFAPEQILVLFFDELGEDAEAFSQKVFSFLEVDQEFTHAVVGEKINPVMKPRSPLAAKLVYQGGRMLRKCGLTNLAGAIKRHPLFWRTFFNGPDSDKCEPSIEDKKYLRGMLEHDQPALESLLGRTLPEAWFAPIQKD